MISSVQTTQAPAYPHVSSTTPKTGGNVGTDAFFYPLLGSVMTSNEHDMLTKFLKLKPPVHLGFETKADNEFIIGCCERLHKLSIIHQLGVDLLIFNIKVSQPMVENLYGMEIFYFTTTYLEPTSCLVFREVCAYNINILQER